MIAEQISLVQSNESKERQGCRIAAKNGSVEHKHQQ
jgi:hypothetical protein